MPARRFSVGRALWAAALVLMGAGLGAVCVGAIWTSGLQTPGARVPAIVLAVAGLGASGWIVAQGVGVARSALPGAEHTVRAARDLSGEQATVHEIPVSRAWRFDLGDDDTAAPLLVETPDHRFVLITDAELDTMDNAADPHADGTMLASNLRIEKHGEIVLRLCSEGEGRVGVLTVTPADAGEAWNEIWDVPTEREIEFDHLPTWMQTAVRPPAR